MSSNNGLWTVGRRGLLRTGVALGAAGLVYRTEPTWAQSEKPIKIGGVESQTGNFAVLGLSQIKGSQMAVEEINAKGGLLSRPLQLIVEDSAGNPGTGINKASRLLDQDKVDFLIGTTSSAVSLSVSQFAAAHNILFVCTGGHVDKLTGTACNANTFRTCSTTWMLTAGDFDTLVKKFGKKWYFLTTDYAFGHSEQEDYAKQLGKVGGTVLGNALAPVGTGDFSSYLIAIKAARPDVLCLLLAGDDQINAMKQITQFGLNKSFAIAGALFELEQIAALPEPARYGWWTMEWYWNQPNVPHVADFVARYRKKFDGQYPTARSWFGYATVHAIGLAVTAAKATDTMKVVKAMEGLELPPEVALQPGSPAYRAEDHQLMLGMFPGSVNQSGTYPDLFNVSQVVPGAQIALSAADMGCKMTYPS